MANQKSKQSMSQDKVKAPREYRYFSEDVRRQIVKEIEDKVYSKAEAARVYKVSQTCIYKWITLYSLNYQKRIVVVAELESESVKRKKLEAQVKDLQTVVGQQTVENIFYKQLIEVISEHYDFDLKKNINMMSSDELERIKKLLDKKTSS
jgi:transposase-like protein